MSENLELFLESAITGAFCVARDGEIIFESKTVRGDRLVENLASKFQEYGLDQGSLAAVYVTTGPGGYTGTRVGIATALGLVRAGRIEGLGIDLITLLLTARDDAELVFVPAGKKEWLIAKRNTPAQFEFVKNEELRTLLTEYRSVGIARDDEKREVPGSESRLTGADLLRLMISKRTHFDNDLTPVYGRTFGKE